MTLCYTLTNNPKRVERKYAVTARQHMEGFEPGASKYCPLIDAFYRKKKNQCLNRKLKMSPTVQSGALLFMNGESDHLGQRRQNQVSKIRSLSFSRS